MRSILVALSLLCLISCGSSSEVTVQTSDYNKHFSLQGPMNSQVSLTGPNCRWNLVTLILKDQHRYEQILYAEITYTTDFKYFKYASDQNAKTLKVVPIYHTGGHCGTASCVRSEDIMIHLDDATLRSSADTGYRVQLLAKSGDVIKFDITPTLIKKQLAALDKYWP